MELFTSPVAPEQELPTRGLTSPDVSGRIEVECVDVDALFQKAKTEGLVRKAVPRRRVNTAISKTVCAILHKPSGEYVEKGFRGLTKDPQRIKFWDRKCDAKKVLTNWIRSENEYRTDNIYSTEFEFIEREIFLPSTEVV